MRHLGDEHARPCFAMRKVAVRRRSCRREPKLFVRVSAACSKLNINEYAVRWRSQGICCRKEKTQTPLLCHNTLKRDLPHATGGGHLHECARSDLPANATCARTRSKGSPPAPRSPPALRCHCPETEGCRVRQLLQNMLAGHESGAHSARTESCPLGRPHACTYRCDCRAAGSRPWR